MIGQLLISLFAKTSVSSLVIAISLAGIHNRCGTSSRNANVSTSINTNSAAGTDKLNPVELKLVSEKTELRAGQCADLRLTVLNSGTRAIVWKGDWVFEQEGPTPPLPESFPRSEIELPPGVTTDIVAIRLCHSYLAPGTYRYRITASPKSENAVRSNEVTIEVLR